MATDILTPNKILSETSFEHHYKLSESDRQAIIQQSISFQKIEQVGIEILETNGYILAEKDRQAIINSSPLAKNMMRIEKLRQEFIERNGCEF